MHGRGAHLEGYVRAVVSSGQVRGVAMRSCRTQGSSLAVARPYSPVPYHRPNPPAGQEGRCPRMPGITLAPDRRCAAGTTREGVASAPPWEISRAIQGGSVSGDSMPRREALAATRGGQQLGRTRQWERRGSTGKAGRSKAGERLAIRLFIDGLLLCRSLGHYRHQAYRYGDICPR
jgi:hypothetical protein